MGINTHTQKKNFKKGEMHGCTLITSFTYYYQIDFISVRRLQKLLTINRGLDVSFEVTIL